MKFENNGLEGLFSDIIAQNFTTVQKEKGI